MQPISFKTRLGLALALATATALTAACDDATFHASSKGHSDSDAAAADPPPGEGDALPDPTTTTEITDVATEPGADTDTSGKTDSDPASDTDTTKTKTDTKTDTTTTPPDTPEKVEASCKSSPMLTKVQKVDFPDPGKPCNWEHDGNGKKAQDKIRARTEQKVTLDVPKNAIICDLQFAFTETTMRYDDEIFLTFNDAILAASMDYTGLFEKSGAIAKYNWKKLYDADYAWNKYPVYCLGADDDLGTCVVPPTETTGEMSVEFDASITHQLAVAAIKAGRYDLGWITLGDNDEDKDCRHDDFKFQVTIKYVKK